MATRQKNEKKEEGNIHMQMQTRNLELVAIASEVFRGNGQKESAKRIKEIFEKIMQRVQKHEVPLNITIPTSESNGKKFFFSVDSKSNKLGFGGYEGGNKALFAEMEPNGNVKISFNSKKKVTDFANELGVPKHWISNTLRQA